ncbi:hypothetical protein C8R44DRAFT_229814 [Mycena epipterygia]|nr:hypothetical protein C8R44DRAFT_229814 [Mycena epipterygia]
MASDSSAFTISITPTKPFDLDITITATTLVRHHQLTTTNEPPGESEEAFIRSVISKTGAHLAHIDDKIARLQDPSRLQELEEERASHASYHAQNKAILSALRRIPPEVLGQIFAWTLPTPLDPRRQEDASDSPWVLVQICSRWRAVALSLPSLWSLFVIDFSWNKINPLSMFETQISRAQGLSIHFFGSQKKDSRPQIEMFQLLAEHSSRWEELSVSLTSDLFPLLASLRHRLPSLRRLWIQWSDSMSHVGVESIDCFEVAPSLLDASFCNLYRHVPILLPARQLTRYHLGGPRGIHQGMLKLTPNLVEARVIIGFQTEPWPGPGEIIELPSLRRLYVSRPTVLQYIKAPTLEEIAAPSMKNDSPNVLTFLKSFIVRSACSLRRLCFERHPDPYTTLEILHANPSIIELAISTDSNAGEGSRPLMSSLMVPTVAPQLSGISVACDKEGYIDYTAYLQLLQFRSKAVGCALKTSSLVVNSGPRPDPVTLRGLEVLRQDGLELLLLEGQGAASVIDDWKLFPPWIR